MVPVVYFTETNPSEFVTFGPGTAVECDGPAPNGRVRIFLPPVVIANKVRPYPMIVVSPSDIREIAK